MIKNLERTFHHYFIPHESNNYRARTLHPPFLIFYIIILLFIQSFYSLVNKIDPNILGFATDISTEKILYLINLERVKANLSPLKESTELARAAQGKAGDMITKDYWAHISPTGTTPWQFITQEGYQYIYAGENLAKSFDTSDEVVAAWMKSPTHRANIMKPEYAEIGMAVVNGNLSGEETTLVVQEFGSRTTPLVASREIKDEQNVEKEELPLVQVQANEINKKPAVDKPQIIINNKSKRTVALLITEFLLVILFIDSLFIWKHKTVRIAGHSLTHIMFLLALLGAVSATGIGAIL